MITKFILSISSVIIGSIIGLYCSFLKKFTSVNDIETLSIPSYYYEQAKLVNYKFDVHIGVAIALYVIGIIGISSKRFRKLNFVHIIALVLIVGLVISHLPLFNCENGLCNDFWTKYGIYDGIYD
jgi:hypothetical protein